MAKPETQTETPNTNATPTADAPKKAPKGSSLNARAKASLKAIVDLLAAGQKIGADVLKTAADIVAEFPLAGSGIDSSKPLAEQLADVQALIKEQLESYKVVNGKVVEDEEITERLRVLTDKKRRIKAAMKPKAAANASA